MASRERSGRTEPGSTEWKAVTNNMGVSIGIYVDVTVPTVPGLSNFDTTKAVPVYITSLGGKNQHWATTGATSIYKATHTGFRVYVRWINGAPLTPDFANDEDRQWHINWVGRQEW